MPGKSLFFDLEIKSTRIIKENMQNYYTYDGSLTTPMCYESVRWIVFRDRMGLSRRQVRTDIVSMNLSVILIA
jgi:carbonic anhydrase